MIVSRKFDWIKVKAESTETALVEYRRYSGNVGVVTREQWDDSNGTIHTVKKAGIRR